MQKMLSASWLFYMKIVIGSTAVEGSLFWTNRFMSPQIELRVNITLVEIHWLSLTWKLHSSTSKGEMELPLEILFQI
jgi:hypothetical protein